VKRSKKFEKRKKFVMELLGDPLYKPMRLREIGSLLRLDKGEKKELFEVLDELCAQGKAEVDNKGRYSKASGRHKERGKKKDRFKSEKKDRNSRERDRREEYREEHHFSEKDGTIMEGTFIGHYKGFGFVEVEDQEQDIFIPENDTGSAMHQDKVQILVRNGHKEGKRPEGVVLKVLERGMPSIVGTYQSSRDYGFVISDNPKFSKDIFISRKNSMGAKDGDKVVVEVTDYGSRNRKPEGKVTEVLGNLRSPGTDILAIVKSFNIPSVFPDKVLRQADRVPDHVQEADMDGRLDLRDFVTVTIDGEDAKDLDDAISLTKENGIYHLGVHIADVSNYVQGGSALDREALKRGTSVYLADRVIPMLPERLSNGICSLNQGQDRLTLSCLMDINEFFSFFKFF
jgi:ribonuclease R